MNVIGIIAEYNPFHNGHLLQFNTCRSAADADYVVVVLGSDFLQRGEPSMFTKYARADLALRMGADLVLELPIIPSCGSAPYFAGGGISLLKHTGVVTHLGFGSETGDLKVLESLVAKKAAFESSPTLSDAHNYARAIAGHLNPEQSKSRPNDTLAMEYMAAINRMKADIRPITVKRTGADYHEQALCHDTINSASSIRQALMTEASPIQAISSFVPEKAASYYETYMDTMPLISREDFYPLIRSSLLNCEHPNIYFDISEDLANRLNQYKTVFSPYEDWMLSIKTKNYTYAHLSRALCHILLGIRKEDVARHRALDESPYMRVLGFRRSASELMKRIKANSDLPLISKMADAEKLLSEEQYALFKLNTKSARIYKSVLQSRTPYPLRDEVQESPIIL